MTERCAVAFQEIGVQMLPLEAPDTDGNPKFETNFLALITPPDALETLDQPTYPSDDCLMHTRTIRQSTPPLHAAALPTHLYPRVMRVLLESGEFYPLQISLLFSSISFNICFLSNAKCLSR